MFMLSKSSAISAVALAAVLIVASTATVTGYAATPPQGATPIANGQATGGTLSGLAVGPTGASLEFNLVVLPNGALNGHARLTSYDGWVEFDLTSFAVSFFDGRVSVAGPATKVFGSPGFGPDSGAPWFSTVEVGETLFFSVLDNSAKGIPDAFIEGKVPSFLPPGLKALLTTIQAIQAVTGEAPEAWFREVENGNLMIH
jgi:hypothetical protein